MIYIIDKNANMIHPILIFNTSSSTNNTTVNVIDSSKSCSVQKCLYNNYTHLYMYISITLQLIVKM